MVMRYVVLALLAIFGVVLSGSTATGLNIAGIEVDLVFLIIISITFIEKSSMPIVFAAATGLLMDVLYSTVLGMHALSYTATAAVLLLVFRRFAAFNLGTLLLAGVGGYILKEGIMGMLVYILGGRFSMTSMMLRNILPAALLSGVLLLAAYWLLSQLFAKEWMRPRARHRLDDF